MIPRWTSHNFNTDFQFYNGAVHITMGITAWSLGVQEQKRKEYTTDFFGSDHCVMTAAEESWGHAHKFLSIKLRGFHRGIGNTIIQYTRVIVRTFTSRWRRKATVRGIEDIQIFIVILLKTECLIQTDISIQRAYKPTAKEYT